MVVALYLFCLWAAYKLGRFTEKFVESLERQERERVPDA